MEYQQIIFTAVALFDPDGIYMHLWYILWDLFYGASLKVIWIWCILIHHRTVINSDSPQTRGKMSHWNIWWDGYSSIPWNLPDILMRTTGLHDVAWFWKQLTNIHQQSYRWCITKLWNISEILSFFLFLMFLIDQPLYLLRLLSISFLGSPSQHRGTVIHWGCPMAMPPQIHHVHGKHDDEPLESHYQKPGNNMGNMWDKIITIRIHFVLVFPIFRTSPHASSVATGRSIPVKISLHPIQSHSH